MINRTRAYEKFLTLLNQIDNSNMSLDEQKELLDEMKSDIEFKIQQVYADKNEWQKLKPKLKLCNGCQIFSLVDVTFHPHREYLQWISLKKIQEQAKENQSEAGKEYGNGKNSSSPNGEKLNVHTDKELAKMAGVGIGTIARYNQVK